MGKLGTILTLVALLLAGDAIAQRPRHPMSQLGRGQPGIGGFVKFEGIDGEAVEAAHSGWSRLAAWTHVVAGDDAQSGSAAPGEIIVAKRLDRASPGLLQAALEGRVFPKVRVDLTRSFVEKRDVVYYSVELRNVRITRYEASGDDASGHPVPLEEMSLGFAGLKVVYTEHDGQGAAKAQVPYEHK